MIVVAAASPRVRRPERVRADGKNPQYMKMELHLSCAVIFHASSDESFGNLKKTNSTDFLSGHVRRLMSERTRTLRPRHHDTQVTRVCDMGLHS